jgi:hypothetical protein
MMITCTMALENISKNVIVTYKCSASTAQLRCMLLVQTPKLAIAGTRMYDILFQISLSIFKYHAFQVWKKVVPSGRPIVKRHVTQRGKEYGGYVDSLGSERTAPNF